MPVQAWYASVPDQQFGAKFTTDEECVDRFLAGLARRDAEGAAGPVTVATALEVAADLSQDRG
jgi:hypothetical protein